MTQSGKMAIRGKTESQSRIYSIVCRRGRGMFSLTLGFVLCGLAPSMGRAETVTYYYTDNRQTILTSTDSSGNIQNQNDYRPYGSQVIGQAVAGPAFDGHVYDPSSGLIYMQGRYYDPASGRFVSIDPAGVRQSATSTFNRYSFADDDPIGNIDLFGWTTWPADGRVTSRYGAQESAIRNQPHQGVDIANPRGAPVRASDGGRVISTRNGPGGEHQVIILNSDGSVSGYAHVASSVQVGDVVTEGQQIGTTDTSGHSTGPHLHYSYRPAVNAPRADPETHLPQRNQQQSDQQQQPQQQQQEPQPQPQPQQAPDPQHT